MQRQHGVVLGLRVTVAGIQRERVIVGFDALGTGDCGVAMLIEYEYVQERRLGDVRLAADVRELFLDGGIGDANRGLIVEELAGRCVLRYGLQRGDDVVTQLLVLELADGTTLQKRVDGVVMNEFGHTAILTRLHDPRNRDVQGFSHGFREIPDEGK